jgi:hypothetical protein
VVIPENAATGFPRMLESDLGMRPSARKISPEEGEQPEGAAGAGEKGVEGKQGAAAEIGEGLVKRKKWYEGLMFWRTRK